MVNIDNRVILEAADALFEEQGFDGTSLQDIADKAQVPLAEIEHHYPKKEVIALKIYHAMADTSLSQADDLPDGNISERYFVVIEDKLAQLNQHQEAVSALFAIAMRPSSEITAAEISPGLRDPMMGVMQQLIANAADKPTKDADELALFLYTFHFLVIVFWLYDRTDEKAASHMFTTFLRDFIKLIRPMLVMPLVAKALKKLAMIMMVVFGGAKLLDSSSASSE